MENRSYIDQAKEMLSNDYTDDSIIYYLKEAGADQIKLTEIIEIARTEFLEEKVKIFTKKNKFSYYLWLTITIATFIIFMFVLPLFQFGVGHTFFLSLVGAVFCCFFAFHAWMYRKSWEEKYVKTIGRPKMQYEFLIVLLLPGIVLHFLFSFRFSMAQDSMLKDTQIEVVGHVIGGRSLEVKRVLGGGVADFTDIIVEFETKEGQKLTISKDISSYQFRKFYKGQEIRLIYSKTNPRNIDLLADESSIRKFKNSQERDFEPYDLMHLVKVKQGDLLEELNKINYGWTYDQSKNIWINEKRQCVVTVVNNELRLIGKEDYNLSYPIYLQRNGFTMTSKENPDDIFHTGLKVFENEEFIFNVEAKVNAESGHSIITIIRK